VGGGGWKNILETSHFFHNVKTLSTSDHQLAHVSHLFCLFIRLDISALELSLHCNVSSVATCDFRNDRNTQNT